MIVKIKKKKFSNRYILKRFFFFFCNFSGLWRTTVWRGSFPSSNELHGQISDRGRYTTDKTSTAWCSVYVPGIQIKRNQPPNLRETGHIHRQINNTRGVNGEWQRCEISTPGGRESSTCLTWAWSKTPGEYLL